MIKKSIFLAIYLLNTISVLFTSVSVAETKQSCTEKFNTWLERYASSNVFVALSKTQEPPFSVDELKQSIKRSPFSDIGDFYKSVTDNDRMDVMSKRILSIFDQSEKSELVLVLAGGAHAVDIYLRRPEDSATAYAGTKIDSSVHFYSKKLREFVDRECVGLLPSAQAVIVKEIFGRSTGYAIPYCLAGPLQKVIENRCRCSRILLEQLAAYLKSRSEIDYERFIQTEVPRVIGALPQRVMIGESHFFDATAIFDGLPSAECIPLLGYSRVKLVVEGVESKARIHGEEFRKFLEKLNYFKMLDYAEKNKGYIKNLIFRHFYKSELQELSQAGMSSHPTFLAFSEYGVQLERGGVGVEFLGVDTGNKLGYPGEKNSETMDILRRSFHYQRNNTDRLLVVDREGTWYTSIEFQGIGKIQFFSGEERTVVNHLLENSLPPRKISENWCGLSRCSTFQFTDSGEEVTLYSSDVRKFLGLFD